MKRGGAMTSKSLQDKRKSICLFCLVFTVYALVYMSKNSFSAAMADIVARGVMTKSQTGMITAVFYAIYAPLQIVGGIVADRCSPKHLILIGTLGGAICNLLVYCFAGNYAAMLVIWSCNAVVQFGLWPSVFKIIASQLHAEHRGRAVVLINVSVNVGLLISYAAASMLEDWKENFLFSTALMLASAVLFFIVYTRLERDMNSGAVAQAMSAEHESVGQAKREKRGDLFAAIMRSGVPLILLSYFIMNSLHLGMKSLAPVMLMESYDTLGPSLANALNILLIAASCVGTLVAYLPVWRRMHEVAAIAILTACVLPPIVALVAVGRIPLPAEICAMIMINVVLSATIVFFMMVSKAFEAYGGAATVAGLFNCMGSVSIVVVNSVFTHVAEEDGWTVVGWTWLVLAAVVLAVIPISILMWGRFLKGIRGKTQVKD